MRTQATLINPDPAPCPKQLGRVQRVQRVFGLVCALCVPAHAAQVLPEQVAPLGTLLYSPAERAGINRARLGLAAEAGSAAAVLRQVTVNGVVNRQGNKDTVWLNGQALPDGATLPPVKTLSATRSGAKLDGQRVRVGETLDLDTKARTDLVLPGAVTRP